LVVAADGGNSKTDLILATADGTVLAQVRGPGTHSPKDGADATAAMLAGLAAQSLHDAAMPADTPVDIGVFFCANVDNPDQVRELRDALVRTGVCRRVEVGNDTLAVLNAGAPDGWGVAVVVGAGINATGADRRGRTAGFLAIGRCSGDLGGGGWVATEGQAAAMRAADGRGPATSLERVIPDHFHLPSPADVAFAIDDDRITWLDLLTACPVVFAQAQAGDEVATAILATQADEIGTMVAALAQRLGFGDEPVPVVLGGSVMTHGGALNEQIVAKAIHARLPQAHPTFLDVPPVQGSLACALRLLPHNTSPRA